MSAQKMLIEPAAVLDAQQWFVHSYVTEGSGWFKDAQAAIDLFADLTEDGYLTQECYEQYAEAWRKYGRGDIEEAKS